MKVDIIISVFGKPWQTLCTLKSLMKYSSKHIDRIFFIQETHQPYNDQVDWVVNHFDNIDKVIPPNYNFYGVRYQQGFFLSNKKWVFITHNDVLYTGDIIGEMLSICEGSVGVGQIGQCWNCPANERGLCSGEKIDSFKPSYSEAVSLFPYKRTPPNFINKKNPMPFPECRLNEWACLVNREISLQEGEPYFGESNFDVGVRWFRKMFLKGYKFKYYNKNFIHGFWAGKSGYRVQLNKSEYFESERVAEKYFNDNFK